MERDRKEPAGAYISFVLPSQEVIEAKLDMLRLQPALLSRLTRLQQLADQEISGWQLTEVLAAAANDYADSKGSSMKKTVLISTLNQIPNFLAAFVPEQLMEDTNLVFQQRALAILQQFMPDENMSDNRRPRKQTSPVKGAPRRIKAIYNKSQEQRTTKETKDLEGWLGRQGLRGTKSKHPSQREMAQRWAERDSSEAEEI